MQDKDEAWGKAMLYRTFWAGLRIRIFSHEQWKTLFMTSVAHENFTEEMA